MKRRMTEADNIGRTARWVLAIGLGMILGGLHVGTRFAEAQPPGECEGSQPRFKRSSQQYRVEGFSCAPDFAGH